MIDVRKIEDLTKEKNKIQTFGRSAINPMNGKLYIISSINKVLVVADKNGVPEASYRISPELYKQPEGMTI